MELGTIKINDSVLDIAKDMLIVQALIKDAITSYKQAEDDFLQYYLGEAEGVELTYVPYFLKKLETLQEFYGEAGYFIENSYTELNNLNRKIAGVFDSGFKEIK